MNNFWTSVSVWSAAVRMATPILLAALGCLICSKAGVTNLAIDGFMTIGCFISIVAIDQVSGSVWIAILFAIIGTSLYSLLFGFAVIKLKANEIISSIAMNMLSVGLTTFLMSSVFRTQGLYRPPNIIKIQPVNIVALQKIPIINALFNNQNIIVYVVLLLVFLMQFIFRRTRYGLHVTALGESREAAHSAGLSTNRIMWSVVVISGALCGLAGAFISTITLSEFSVGMVAGRGFTAFTAAVFGALNPILVAIVSLMFGYADSVGIQLGLLDVGIPASIISMFPYVLALIVLLLSSLIRNYRYSTNKLDKARK